MQIETYTIYPYTISPNCSYQFLESDSPYTWISLSVPQAPASVPCLPLLHTTQTSTVPNCLYETTKN